MGPVGLAGGGRTGARGGGGGAGRAATLATPAGTLLWGADFWASTGRARGGTEGAGCWCAAAGFCCSAGAGRGRASVGLGTSGGPTRRLPAVGGGAHRRGAG